MNLSLIQTISALSGLVTTGTLIVIAAIGSFYIIRSGVRKTTSEAQQDAIVALQAQVSALRNNVEDLTKENARLEQVVQTICSALKTRGMIITVQGELITIEDVKTGRTTATRIHENGKGGKV